MLATRTFLPQIGAATELADADCFVVVFAEHPDGDGEHIALSRALSFDEQDRELRQDTFCICIDGGPTHYKHGAGDEADSCALAA